VSAQPDRLAAHAGGEGGCGGEFRIRRSSSG